MCPPPQLKNFSIAKSKGACGNRIKAIKKKHLMILVLKQFFLNPQDPNIFGLWISLQRWTRLLGAYSTE